MKVVTCMGMAYRVTDRNYRRLLEAIHETGGADIEKYGKRLGDVVNITDMSQEEAASILANLGS